VSIKYLYYTEDTSTGGVLSAAFAVPFLDQLLLMYGGERMCVHQPFADYRPSSPEHYPSLQAAQNAYPSHTWIFLRPDGLVFLDEIAHPVDNVVYAVGHDLEGFRDEEPQGTMCKLRVIPNDFAGHAMICLGVAAVMRSILTTGGNRNANMESDNQLFF